MTIPKKMFEPAPFVPVELSPKERLFVKEYADRLGTPHAKRDAGLAAGLSPSGNPNAARVRASELLDPDKRPDIHEAINNYAVAEFASLTALLPRKAIELLNCGERRIELKTLELIAERGWGSIIRRTANLNHNTDENTLEHWLSVLDKIDMDEVGRQLDEEEKAERENAEVIESVDFEEVEAPNRRKRRGVKARLLEASKMYDEG